MRKFSDGWDYAEVHGLMCTSENNSLCKRTCIYSYTGTDEDKAGMASCTNHAEEHAVFEEDKHAN